jgi:hypothetical protein
MADDPLEPIAGKAQEAMGDVPKVLIGYPLYGRQVYAGFAHSLHRLQIPPLTDVTPQEGHTTASCRNALCHAAITGGYTHVFMLDTDMTYPDETLITMLADDNPVECCFAVARRPPHFPVFGEEGEERYTYLSQWPTESGKRMGKVLLGAIPTAIVGGAGLLIKTEILSKLPSPWFSHEQKLTNGDDVGEDAYFSQKCRDNDIPLFCRTDVLCGHTAEVILLPEWHDSVAANEVEEEQLEEGTGAWEITPHGLGPFYQGPSHEERERIRTNVAARKALPPTVGELTKVEANA